MKFIDIVTIGSLGMFLSACGGGTEPSLGNSQGIPTLSSTVEQEYLSAINEARTKNQSCGTFGAFSAAPALTWNEKLYKSSYEHSYDMATTNTFSHIGSGQPSDWTGTALGTESVLSQRVEAYRYSWSRIAENIGAGTDVNSAKIIVVRLMESDGHCANIMNPDYTEVGMALVKNSNTNYIYYWTQNFGTQR